MLFTIALYLFAIFGFIISCLLGYGYIEATYIKRPSKVIKDIVKDIKENPKDWKHDLWSNSFTKETLRVTKHNIRTVDNLGNTTSEFDLAKNSSTYFDKFEREQRDSYQSRLLREKVNEVIKPKSIEANLLALSKKEAKEVKGLGEL